MIEHVHPGPHPDPESLNAFLEGVLPEPERLQCLSHFAECARCREIVFLAQPPRPSPVSSKEAPAWRRWFAPIPVLSGAVAALVVFFAISLNRYQHTDRLHDALIPAQSAAQRQGPSPTTIPKPHADAVLKMAPEAYSVSDNGSLDAPPEMSTRAPQSAAPRSAPPGTPSSPRAMNDAPSVFGQTLRPLPSPAPPSRQPAAEPTQNKLVPLSEKDMKILAQKALPRPGDSFVSVPGLADSLGRSSLTLHLEHQRSTLNGLSEIKGSVTDVTGAAITGATVSVRQDAGAASGTTVSGQDGRFTMTALPPGSYELQIKSRGFQKASGQLELQPQDVATVESKLSVGSVAETVEVTAASPARVVALNGALVPEREALPLPSKRPLVSSAGRGLILLAADSEGALFLSRDAGQHWKAVKPQWQGKVAQVLASSGPKPAPAPGSSRMSSAVLQLAPIVPPLVFKLVTDTGSVWFSQDGMHWQNQLPKP